MFSLCPNEMCHTVRQGAQDVADATTLWPKPFTEALTPLPRIGTKGSRPSEYAGRRSYRQGKNKKGAPKDAS
jgi:hypothetical protein